MITRRLRCPVCHTVVYYEEVVRPRRPIVIVKAFRFTSVLYDNLAYLRCPQCGVVLRIYKHSVVGKATRFERMYYEYYEKRVEGARNALRSLLGL